jgi:hypothetical protein
MKKDVIYIDVEDDLTAIIEKIKGAQAGIVALVPPRRLGVLQSVVNLKLLKRAADEAGKKPVLITSDASLTMLTAGLNIPVARNLQSRPEIVPEDADIDGDTNEVIEGQAMPDADAKGAPAATPPAASAAAAKSASPKKSGKKFKVPNFDSFRKRLLLFGGIGAVVILFLVWAIFIAPHATVTVKAQANKVAGDFAVAADSALDSTNAQDKSIQAQIREDKKNLSQTFTATGKKDTGTKATGSITIRNCDYPHGFTLNSGAQFTASSGQTFVSTQTVTVPEFAGTSSGCTTSGSSAGKATVPVQASDIGESFNVSAQSYAIPGITGKVDAVGTAMAGGTKKTITVVTQDDVAKAKAALLAQDTNAEKQKLASQFDKNTQALPDTFTAQAGDAAASPGVDQEASQSTLTIPMNYSVLGVKNDDVNKVLSAYFDGKIDDKNQQKVYDNGYKKLKITTKQPQGTKATLQFTTNGYIGPNIDVDKLKPQVVGKKDAEISDLVKSEGGPTVQSVDTKFSPFWVNKAPKVQKVKIDLKVANEQ